MLRSLIETATSNFLYFQACTLYAEYLPTNGRGRAVMSLQFFWSFGAVFLSFAAWAIMPTLGWRYLVGFSTIPLALFVCMSPFVLPESPFYLASVGDKQRLELELEKVIRLREKPNFLL